MSPERGSDRRPSGLLTVLSGPSGVGKDAVVSRMREQGKPYHFTVTATTRPRRAVEQDGVDYIFVSTERFRRMIEDGELLEWAEVYGNLYGVPRAQVVDALDRGKDVVIKADVQGAATIKKLFAGGVFVFLAAPSFEELALRLKQRMSESPDGLELRLRTARAEMDEAHKFDHVVVNHRDRLDEAVSEIEAIVAEEKRRAPRRRSLVEEVPNLLSSPE